MNKKSLVFMFIILFTFCSFSINTNASILDDIFLFLGFGNETDIIEYEPINYTEPTERVVRVQATEGINSQSYVVTLTGNEINYDVNYNKLDNGSIQFIISSPELSDYDIEETDTGKILKEKNKVYNDRKNKLKEEKVKDKFKYDKINAIRKEVFIYDKLPLKIHNQTLEIDSIETDVNIVYEFIVDPKYDKHFKFGENTGEVNLTADLVSYWKFDETSGTTAVDSHGTKNGTITNALVNQTGKINKSYSFDGSGDYVDFGDMQSVFSNRNTFTTSFWFNSSNTASTKAMMINRLISDTGSNYNYYTDLNANTVRFSILNSSGTAKAVTSNITVTTNTWYHVVSVYNGTNMLLYINNVLVGNTATTDLLKTTTSATFRIGRNVNAVSSQDYAGLIDEPAIWDRALTSSEITELYNDGDGLSYDDFINTLLDFETLNATLITNSSARLNANITDIKDNAEVNASFQYREYGESDWINTTVYNITSNGTYHHNLTGLKYVTTYEFRTMVEINDEVEHGDILNFTTLELISIIGLNFSEEAPVYTTQTFNGLGNISEDIDARVNYKIIRQRNESNTTLSDSFTTTFTNVVQWVTSTVATSSTQQGDYFWIEARVVNESATTQNFSNVYTSNALEIVNRNPLINNLFYDKEIEAVTVQDFFAYINVTDLDLDSLNVLWELNRTRGAVVTNTTGTNNSVTRNANIGLVSISADDTEIDDLYTLTATVVDNYGGSNTSQVNITIIAELSNVSRVDFDTDPVYTTNDVIPTAVLTTNNSDDIQVRYTITKNDVLFSTGVVTDYTESAGEYLFVLPTISSANTTQADVFVVNATPEETTNNYTIGQSNNNTFTVINRNPSVGTLRFEPTTLFDNLDFDIYATPTDLDENTLTLFWYVERTRGAVITNISSGNTTGLTHPYSEVNLGTISNALIEIDDQIRFYVTPYDGISNGTKQQSSLLTVEEGNLIVISAEDIFTGTDIYNFSVEINGTIFDSNVGGDVIIYPVDNINGTYDIFFFNITDGEGYLNRTFTGISLTQPSNYTGRLYQTIVNFSILTQYGEEEINEFELITGYNNFSTTNGTVTIYPNFNTSYLWNITTTRYYNQTDVNFTIDEREYDLYAYNFTNARIRFIDESTTNAVSNVPIILTYPNGSTFNLVSNSTGYIDVAGQIDGNNSIFNITIDTFQGYVSPITYSYNISTAINVSINLTGFVLNIIFLDELNFSSIGETITLDVIGDYFSGNYTTTTSAINITTLYNSSVILRYNSDTHFERFYYLNPSFEVPGASVNDTLNLTLYLLNNTKDEVTITIYDTSGAELISDVYIKYLKYNISTNSYFTAGMAKTGLDGVAHLSVEKSTEFYKFMIYYPLITLKSTTEPYYIYEDQLNLQLNLFGTIGESFATIMGVTSEVVYNNATGNFRFTYSNTAGTDISPVFTVYEITRTGKTIINTTTSTSSAGTVLLNSPNVEGKTYIAEATLVVDGQTYVLAASEKSNPQDSGWGIAGLIAIIILTLVFVSIGYFNLNVALILAPMPLLFGVIIGFVNVSMPLAVSLQVLAIFIVMVINK